MKTKIIHCVASSFSFLVSQLTGSWDVFQAIDSHGCGVGLHACLFSVLVHMHTTVCMCTSEDNLWVLGVSTMWVSQVQACDRRFCPFFPWCHLSQCVQDDKYLSSLSDKYETVELLALCALARDAGRGWPHRSRFLIPSASLPAWLPPTPAPGQRSAAALTQSPYNCSSP